MMPGEMELVIPRSRARAELMECVADADFIVTTEVDAEMIAAARKLKLIQSAGVGFDGVDVAAATRAGIPVAQTVEGTIVGVAEHAILLALAVFRQLIEADASVRRGEWLVWQLRPTSYLLYGKTVGIFGLGRIGREAARRFAAFGARLVYTDVARAPGAVESGLGVRHLPLDEMARTADVVSIHAPLTAETRHVFDERVFRRMKETAILVNTARGPIVREEALVRALREGWILGAGLDVFEEEPPRRDHPLLLLPNVVLTPHCATGTRESVLEKACASIQNFQRVVAGETPLNVINPEVSSAAGP
jgi:phosphoglycerate dehydrogenase-like enzyme